MKKTILSILAVASVVALTACQSTREKNETAPKEVVTETKVEMQSMAMPNVVIYKTKADYSNLVPLMMNDDKTQVVSYPDPTDVKERKRPTQLDGGYLLDNFGIGKNVVYTDYTYEQYAALESVPELETLIAHIIERAPLVAYYVSTPEYKKTPDYRTPATVNKAIANDMEGFNAIVKE